MFGETLKEYIPKQKSSAILQSFNTKYSWFYQHRMLLKLGKSFSLLMIIDLYVIFNTWLNRYYEHGVGFNNTNRSEFASCNFN